MRRNKVREAMKDWLSLNAAISQFTAEEALNALNVELSKAQPRETFVERLKQRYVAAKTEEARKEVE